MIYMFKVFIVVVAPIFGLAGAVVLALAAWDEAMQYVRARQTIQRMAAVASRERLAISRTDSRNREQASPHGHDGRAIA
jgi:hypothetical protein